MEAVGPLQGGRVVVGHVAVWLGIGEEIAAPVAERPGGRAAGDPAEEVPDVDGLLDHPVARSLAASQPVGVAPDRAVAADPGGPGLDRVAQVAPMDQGDPLAMARVGSALEADVDGQVGHSGGLGDHEVAVGQGQGQGFFGIEVLAGPDRVAIDPGMEVAWQGDDDGLDLGPLQDVLGSRQDVGPGAPGFLGDPGGADAVPFLQVADGDHPGFLDVEEGPEQGRPPIAEADQGDPGPDRRPRPTRLRRPRPGRGPSRPSAEQPRNLRRFKRIGGIGADSSGTGRDGRRGGPVQSTRRGSARTTGRGGPMAVGAWLMGADRP